jgi:quercetin dioxygenase-like cupin family protein
MMTTPAGTPLPRGWKVTAPESPWQELAPGIRVLSLAPGQRQFLVQFDAGAALPEEDVHDGPEHLVILAGSLHLAITGTDVDHYVTEGDRVYADAGTRHKPVAGPDGCRLLATYP